MAVLRFQMYSYCILKLFHPLWHGECLILIEN